MTESAANQIADSLSSEVDLEETLEELDELEEEAGWSPIDFREPDERSSDTSTKSRDPEDELLDRS
ncbi:hypothetical protein ACFQAS_01730 [Halopenitus salinus]|uniref:Uncharacterized protein n=1 Tax=Halopenitus salinus TaxID=1198295 RepID=A0ABD5UXG5_9EURY